MILYFETPFTTFFRLPQIFLPRQLQAIPSQKHLFKPKEKVYQKRKNTAGLIQNDGKLVEKEEKEKVLEV